MKISQAKLISINYLCLGKKLKRHDKDLQFRMEHQLRQGVLITLVTFVI